MQPLYLGKRRMLNWIVVMIFIFLSIFGYFLYIWITRSLKKKNDTKVWPYLESSSGKLQMGMPQHKENIVELVKVIFGEEFEKQQQERRKIISSNLNIMKQKLASS